MTGRTPMGGPPPVLLKPSPGDPPGIPSLPPGPPDPYRNLGFRIGRYARRIFESDLETLSARVRGRADRDERALAEGIAIGSGCIPHLQQNGEDEVCEIRCVFVAGAKRIIVTPSPLRIPPEALRDRQMYEDFAGWLLAREDEDLFEVRFG
ncbi:MAG TPA: hypothetical protein VMB35_07880 [Methanomicrobiales archaeon]|nr:hypothetical protein [Methanomicrobiales archaeon]